MEGILIDIRGNWAHFKKPETNNNPLTHDFITKTAFIGLIGAVLGIERREMKILFPKLSEDFLYGVIVKRPVHKQSWQFTMRKAVDLMSKAPKAMEFLKDPHFIVAIALANSRSKNILDELSKSLVNHQAKFTPVLGLHNCPAEISILGSGKFTESRGDFVTKGFITQHHKIKLQGTENFRIGFDKIPTYQDDDFWNLPEKYVEVSYPTEGKVLNAEGKYYKYKNTDSWVLV